MTTEAKIQITSTELGSLWMTYISTELSHPDKLAENKYKKETKNDENPHEASVFGIIKC